LGPHPPVARFVEKRLKNHDFPKVVCRELWTLKVGKIVSQVGPAKIKALGKTRKDLREAAFQSLKNPRIYVLDPNKKMPARQASLGDAVPQTP
jgi:uncharacterized protein YfeS